MTASEIMEVVFGLLGGLALFLYGMNSMSSSLQKAAGNKMKWLLSKATNPVLCAVIGAVVTAVLQSSSATTVMAIGFVSAGLMTLPQAIAIIFGANIGTTMTAQLLAFKISDYIYPIIFIGFIIYFIAKSDMVKSIGQVIFSFGLLFEGIEIMSSVMKPLASSSFFVNLLGTVADIPILGMLVGALMTLLCQSSSATIAILQNFASQAAADGVSSIIGLTGAIPILLGDNIGTTITAQIASLGQGKDARRTAWAHTIFNVTGSLVCLCILPLFSSFVAWVSPKGIEVEIISRQIANAHMIFNIACTVVWLILLPLMVKIVKFIVPDKKEPAVVSAYTPAYLDETVLSTPITAIHVATEEISRAADYSDVLLISSCNEMTTSTASQQEQKEDTKHKNKKNKSKAEEKEQAAESQEQETTSLQTEHGEVTVPTVIPEDGFDTIYAGVKSLEEQISNFITVLFTRGSLSDEQVEQASSLMLISNNLERIADRCKDITDSIRKIKAAGKSFSEEAREELTECFNQVENLFSLAMNAVETGNLEDAQAVADSRKKLSKAEKRFSKAHLKRVKDKVCDSDLTSDYSAILYNFERIADNCATIAEEALDNVNFQEMALPVRSEQNPEPAKVQDSEQN